MTTKITTLIPSQYLKAALTTFYTAPKAGVLGALTSITAVIDKATATNVDTVNHNLTLYLVPSGSTADNTNVKIINQVVEPKECIDLYQIVGHALNTGGSVQVQADIYDLINIRITGREIS